MKEFFEFYVAPVKEDKTYGHCKQLPMEDAHLATFWTVYGRYVADCDTQAVEVEAIADRDSKEEAETLRAALTGEALEYSFAEVVAEVVHYADYYGFHLNDSRLRTEYLIGWAKDFESKYRFHFWDGDFWDEVDAFVKERVREYVKEWEGMNNEESACPRWEAINLEMLSPKSKTD